MVPHSWTRWQRSFWQRSQPDISQTTSRFAEIIPPYDVEGTEFSPQPTDVLIFRFSCVRKAICPYFPSSRHTPPVDITWPSIFPAYAGAGLRCCRSSIKLSIFRTSSLGTATSANWNVTYRPWLTALTIRTTRSISVRPIGKNIGAERLKPLTAR